MKRAIAIAALAAAPVAVGQIVTIDVGGIQSYGDQGLPENTVLTYNLGAGAEVTGIGWDVTIEAYSPSWLSEATIAFENSAQDAGVFLTPGIGVDEPGVGTYSSEGILDLVDLELNFFVGADGILRVEFFEGFDDGSVAPDGMYLSGTLTVQYVPTPAVGDVLATAGLLATRRRRA